ncbi:UbiA-like protein EboC [Daejeonella sp. H1SJ63]|uniref:UbiA-like protein EboC n=1 Tax=Daejeonella sp. H1SJ63 TaxID=3034145 RepID=UPI0023ED5BFD|nr:UbiA-like protein EboC [Daejeonella sp. H1SJ63]
MTKAGVYLRLMRPANIVTSVADVLAGISVSGYFLTENPQIIPVLLLCLSTIGLYGGGIVFNDVFDADLDRIERPERAIPRGEVSLSEAIVFGIVLLMIGVFAAFALSVLSGVIAFLIAVFALIYDKFGKHHAFLGPLNMGICRGLNLLLGISIISLSLQSFYFLGLIPLIYIFSITMISQGEVHGSNRNKLYLGAFLYLLVISAVLYHSWVQGELILSGLFIILFAYMIYKPLFAAIREPLGKNIGKAVKAGVISLILMDAAWAAASGFLVGACFIAALLPLSLLLAKRFAVT